MSRLAVNDIAKVGAPWRDLNGLLGVDRLETGMPEEASERVTIDQLAHLIDAEIEHAGKQNDRRGVPPWLLTFSLGAVLWSLLDQISKGGIDAIPTLAIAVIMASCGDIVREGWRWTRGVDRHTDRARFGTLSQVFACVGACVVVQCAQSLMFTCILVASWSHHQLGPAASIAGLVVQSVFLAGAASAALLSKTLGELPVPFSRSPDVKGPSPTKVYGLRAVFAGLRVAFVASGAYSLIHLRGSYFSSELRLGGTAAAALYVVHSLTHAVYEPPVIAPLMRLRRGLLLRLKSAEVVALELELLLIGMDAPTLLRSSLTPLIEAFAGVKASFNKLEQMVEGVAVAHERLQGDGVSSREEEDDKQFDKLVSAFEEHRQFVAEHVVPAATKFRAAVVAAKVGGEEEHARQIELRMNQELASVSAKRVAMEARVAEVAARVRGQSSDAGSPKEP